MLVVCRIDTSDRFPRAKACDDRLQIARDEKSVKLFPLIENIYREAIDLGVNAADLFIVSNRGRTIHEAEIVALNILKLHVVRACGMERGSDVDLFCSGGTLYVRLDECDAPIRLNAQGVQMK